MIVKPQITQISQIQRRITARWQLHELRLLMRPMRKLETEDILPKHQRPLDIRDRETGVIGRHDVKRRSAHAPSL